MVDPSFTSPVPPHRASLPRRRRHPLPLRPRRAGLVACLLPLSRRPLHSAPKPGRAPHPAGQECAHLLAHRLGQDPLRLHLHHQPALRHGSKRRAGKQRLLPLHLSSQISGQRHSQKPGAAPAGDAGPGRGAGARSAGDQARHPAWGRLRPGKGPHAEEDSAHPQHHS